MDLSEDRGIEQALRYKEMVLEYKVHQVLESKEHQ
jgi:hypothetical protein